MRIGLVGLGNMGLAMARRLGEAGAEVAGWDCEAAKREAAGLAGRAELKDVAAKVVILSLPHAGAVASVLAELMPVLPRGAVIADTSTLDPMSARRFAAEATGRGLHYVDAPVSGGPSGAASGTLAMMVGGAAEALELARPALERITARILHVGGPGAGQVAKLVNNLLVATHLVTAAEALRLGAKAGVPPEALLPVVNAASGRSAATEVNFPRWILPGGFDSGFSAGLMRKDVGLALTLAEAVGAELDACARAAASWGAHGIGDAEDFKRLRAAILGGGNA